MDRSLSSVLVAAAVGVGLLFPSVAHALLPYIFIALFFVVVFSLSTLEDSPIEILSNVRVFTWTIVSWQMFIVPALVTLVAVVFSIDKTITIVLLATTTAGSVFASPALVQMAGLNRDLAVRGMIITTFLMPVSLLLFGTMNDVLPLDMSFETYGQQIVIFLVAPLILSAMFWAVRERLPSRAEKLTVRGLNWGATLAMMVFCTGVMAKLHRGDTEVQSNILLYFELAVGMTIVMYIATGILFARFGRRDSLTAGMLVANRNVALSFGLLSHVLPEEVMLYVAVSQFPIFLTPLVIAIYQMVQRTYRLHAFSEGPAP